MYLLLKEKGLHTLRYIAMYARTPRGRIQPDSMLCSSCDKKRPTKSLRVDLSKYKIDGDVERLNCGVCDNFIAIKSTAGPNGLVNGNHDNTINVDGALEDKKKTSWLEVKTEKERIIYYILSQIIYPERDPPDSTKFESMYDFADPSDLVMLRWERGVAIGFYTLKLQGSKISLTNEEYAMPTLDTAYIRSEYRKNGFGTEILMNITEMFPDQDVGFSRPISEGMWKVLEKFLTTHKNYRLKFWEIEDGGNEGSRKLVWFTLKKRESS